MIEYIFYCFNMLCIIYPSVRPFTRTLYHPYVIHLYFGTILSDCRFFEFFTKFAGKYVVREGEESPLSIGARDTTEVNISVRQTPAKSLSFGN